MNHPQGDDLINNLTKKGVTDPKDRKQLLKIVVPELVETQKEKNPGWRNPQ